MGNFLIPLAKVAFQMSEVVEQVSHTVSTLIEFTGTGYFHKLYLSGNAYAFINCFSSRCICKEIFFFYVVRSGEHLTEFWSVEFKCARFCSSGKTQSCCCDSFDAWDAGNLTHPWCCIEWSVCQLFPGSGWLEGVCGPNTSDAGTSGKVGGILGKLNTAAVGFHCCLETEKKFLWRLCKRPCTLCCDRGALTCFSAVAKGCSCNCLPAGRCCLQLRSAGQSMCQHHRWCPCSGSWQLKPA